MVHRLALRVLPSLTLAVTQPQVRKQKRLVMLIPGLVAFAIYRVAKHTLPVTEASVLLLLSGAISGATALIAYRIGRRTSWSVLWQEDRAWRIAWIGGWIGAVYGIQLSLLVLALLRLLAGYDFLAHPDGPSLMAIMIACTSVARDAFEIGHIRRLELSGQPFVTFPDGGSLRHVISADAARAGRWVVMAGACGLIVSSLGWLTPVGRTDLAQLLLASVTGGTVALWAYLAGEQRAPTFRVSLSSGWSSLLGFWWWPGLAFAATYYLSLVGAVIFLFKVPTGAFLLQSSLVTTVVGMMALYGYYLGSRRHEEDRIRQLLPSSLLRCPFVMGILTKRRTPAMVAEPANVGLTKPIYSAPVKQG